MPVEQWPSVSVVLPAHDAAEVIDRQLRALAAQVSEAPWELVVVNHRSSDATGAVAAARVKDFPSAAIVSLDSGSGPAHARNVGVRRARGAKILMCDADDEVQPGWLSAMSRALDRYDVVGARLDPTGINPDWLVKARGIPQVEGLPTFLGRPFSMGAALGFRRTVFDALDGFDEQMLVGEDCDFGVRAAAAGFDMGFVPDAAVWCRFRSDAPSAFRQGRAAGRVEALLLIRHGGRSHRRSWWRDSTTEALRVIPRAVLAPLRGDRRGRRVATARQLGRQLGRLQGALRYRCAPW
jgi:glycosyltransferase involved in cell wall biosynthesis